MLTSRKHIVMLLMLLMLIYFVLWKMHSRELLLMIMVLGLSHTHRDKLLIMLLTNHHHLRRGKEGVTRTIMYPRRRSRLESTSVLRLVMVQVFMLRVVLMLMILVIVSLKMSKRIWLIPEVIDMILCAVYVGMVVVTVMVSVLRL